MPSGSRELRLLITLNGLLALSELAIVSSKTVRLQQMARDGSAGAAVALELAATPNRFLSTVQVGITVVGIFAGAIGGATFAQTLADLLSRIRLLAPYSGAISLVLVRVVHDERQFSTWLSTPKRPTVRPPSP